MRDYLKYNTITILLAFALAGEGVLHAQAKPDSIKNALNTQQMTDAERLNKTAHLGIDYYMAGNFDSSRFYLNKALEMPNGRGWQAGRLLVNIANTYAMQGNHIEALKFYLEGLKVGEEFESNSKTEENKIQGQNNIIRAASNASEAFYMMGNRKQALHYAEFAVAEFNSMERPPHYIKPQIYYVIGMAHLDNGELDAAEAAMQTVYEYSDSLNRNELSGGILMYLAYGKEGLARVALARKDYSRALNLADEALAITNQHGDMTIAAKAYATLSEIYYAQEQYAECELYARKALEAYPVYMKINPDVAYHLASASLVAGKTDTAQVYFRIYSEQMKKNADRKFRETMASLEIEFETEKKQMRIAELEQRSKYITIISIIGFFLVITVWILFYIKSRRKQADKELAAVNAVIEGIKRERERIARCLHNGVNGMLAAIRIQLAAIENTLPVANKIGAIIEDIRLLVHSMAPKDLKEKGLITALDDFCAMYPNVHFEWIGQDIRLNKNMEVIIYMCAFEMAYNAVKYSGATKIIMKLVMHSDSVSISVSDNGCGFDKNEAIKGFGFQSLMEMTKAFNGRLHIETEQGKGSNITIEFKIS